MNSPAENTRYRFDLKANPLLIFMTLICLGLLLTTLIMNKPRAFISLFFISIDNENLVKLLPLVLIPLIGLMFVRLHRGVIIDQLFKLPLVLLAVIVLVIPVNPKFTVHAWWPGADAIVATRSWSDAEKNFTGRIDFFNMRGQSGISPGFPCIYSSVTYFGNYYLEVFPPNFRSWNPRNRELVQQICEQNTQAWYLSGQSREQALLAGDIDRYFELQAVARTIPDYRTDLSLVLGQFSEAEQNLLQRVLPDPRFAQHSLHQSSAVQNSPISVADVAVIHGRLDVLKNVRRTEEGHIYAAIQGALNQGLAFDYYLPELQRRTAYDVAIGRCDGPMLTQLYVADLPLIDAHFVGVMDSLLAEDLAPFISDATLQAIAELQCSKIIPYYLALFEAQVNRDSAEFTSQGDAIFRAANEATKHLYSEGAQTEPGLTMKAAAAYLSLLPANQRLVDTWIRNGLGSDGFSTAPLSAYEPLRSLPLNWQPSQNITVDYLWYRESLMPFAEFAKAQVEGYLRLNCSLEEESVHLRCAANDPAQQ